MTRYTIIVPALNEEASLPATLSAVRSAFGDSAECIVSDGGSSDATCAVARQFGAMVVEGSGGRGPQLHRGYCAARGEVCVFLHADTLLPPGARSAIERVLVNPAVIGGAFSLDFGDSARQSIVLRLHQAAINLRARLMRNATGDHAMFVRRAALAGIGGVPQVPLFEDVRLCRALKRAGSFVILPERVTTSARLWQRVGPLRGILFHWALQAAHALGASPGFLARHYPMAR